MYHSSAYTSVSSHYISSAPNNGKLKKLTYGNGYYEEYTYDHLDRIKQIKYNGDSTKTYTLTYSNDGGVYSITDTVAGIKYIYEYDSLGRLIRGEQRKISDNSSQLFVENRFDSLGRSSGGSYALGSKTLNYGITYKDNSNLVNSFVLPDGKTNGYTYDSFDRLTWKKYHNLAYYSMYRYYEPTSTATSSLVSLQFNNYNGGSSKYNYTYDILGNITEIYEDDVLKLSYEYDSLGQLVRENNAYANKTWVYTYDLSGNITARKEYSYTVGTLPESYTQKIYSYSTGTWGDLLTAYDGTTISYDAIGNPTNWRNGASLTWDGRKLTSHSGNNGDLAYLYNSSGIRTAKTYNTPTNLQNVHEYTLDGTNIIRETIEQYYDNSTLLSTVDMYFYYDETGVCGMEYNGVTYYFLKNIQGDVINILNTSGQVVVTYTYDAWGKVLSMTGSLSDTVGFRNPFRYRGYYYDTETGFYYLQTRYYDPEVGRFINADGYIGANGDIPGYNMFAYCSNAPINNIDLYGEGLLNLIKKVLKIAYQVIVKVYKAQKEAKDLSNTVEDIYTIISSLENKEAAEYIMVMDVVLLYKYPEYKPDSSYLTNVSQELYYQCCLCAKEMVKSSNDKRVISILNSKRLSKDDARYLWKNANIQLAMRVSQFYSIALPFAKSTISMFVRYGYSIY